MIDGARFSSPKQGAATSSGKFGWYQYYAGYSPAFVHDALTHLNLSDESVIMDPWNGSGTTTQVAEEMGISSIGYDINPVMVVIAKARSLDLGVSESLPSLCHQIIAKTHDLPNGFLQDEEPLETWFVPSGATHLRNIERAIQQILVNHRQYRSLSEEDSLERLSTLAAFFYTALFRTLRTLLTSFRTSNPTWIKTPNSPAGLIDADISHINAVFSNHVSEMAISLHGFQWITTSKSCEPRLDIASSEALPIPNQSIDAVVASPPYCTRIDYAVSTWPELAILGFTANIGIKGLRDRMIGTPTVSRHLPDSQVSWGDTCLSFLNAVDHHPSKASHTYYLKTYLQYFHSIYRSLVEIDRVLVDNGQCVLVVQDSYYKEVHNDLPSIFTEMGESLKWQLTSRSDYQITRTMAGVNRQVAKYRARASAVESALVFRKTA